MAWRIRSLFQILIVTALLSFCFIETSSTFAQEQAAQPDERQARRVFGVLPKPSQEQPQVYGGYAAGCLAGAVRLRATGPGWQAMRPKRNRAYGHPDLIAFVERLSRAAQAAGWRGLLIGDLAQPAGGPMLSGHRSHQTGIDGDIWMRPAPDKIFSRKERDSVPSYVVVARDRVSLNSNWTDTHHQVLRAAAEDAAVARIFVNAAIKKRMCEDAALSGENTSWLRKVRPWWGHDAHFHVRLHCPDGSASCISQDPPPPGDGCDNLSWWFSDEVLNPKPRDPTVKAKPRKRLRMAQLPEECRRLADDLTAQ